MKAKILIIGLIWLMPLVCWLSVPRADATFAVAVGSIAALLLSVFLARQPMLRCGACGASTAYFDNYTPTVAQLTGNRRRYVVCGSCGAIIDRLTGRPVVGVPETPVVAAASRADLGCLVSGSGGLLAFGAVVIGAFAVMAISRDVADSERAEKLLSWCIVTATGGVVLLFAGRFIR